MDLSEVMHRHQILVICNLQIYIFTLRLLLNKKRPLR